MSEAPPGLEERFRQPPNWQWGEFARVAGRRVRTGHLPHTDAKAVAVYLPGLGEPAEKNFETFRDLHAMGLAVHTMDWFGQGGSGRYLANGRKRHAADFQGDIDDLAFFLRESIKPQKPLILLAHSMSGNIALRYLAQTQDQAVKAAILSAPMCGIFAVRYIPEFAAKNVTDFAYRHYPETYLPGGADWKPWAFSPDDGRAHLSSDPARNSLQNLWFAAKPELRFGGATWGWLYHALASCAALKQEAGRITTPVLAALAGREMLVDNTAAQSVLARIERAETVTLKNSLHEILMEKDDIRTGFLNAARNFLKQQGII